MTELNQELVARLNDIIDDMQNKQLRDIDLDAIEYKLNELNAAVHPHNTSELDPQVFQTLAREPILMRFALYGITDNFCESAKKYQKSLIAKEKRLNRAAPENR